MRLGKVNNTVSLQNEIMSRVRQPLTDAEHGGEPCGDLSETQECNVFACDMPCELDPEWSAHSIAKENYIRIREHSGRHSSTPGPFEL